MRYYIIIIPDNLLFGQRALNFRILFSNYLYNFSSFSINDLPTSLSPIKVIEKVL